MSAAHLRGQGTAHPRPMSAAHPRAESGAVLSAHAVTVRFGEAAALRGVSLDVPAECVVAVTGGAGAGKTTLLRAFNRMNEIVPGASQTGAIRLMGRDVHGQEADAAELRRRVGMVMARSAVFPRSVFENVVFGLRAGRVRGDLHGLAEQALTAVGLWSGDGGLLERPAAGLSPGDQRRVCMARTIALRPRALLLDEPTADLAPAEAAGIESLILGLRSSCAIVVATSDPLLAGRISDLAAFLRAGELIEFGPTARLFTNPAEPATEAYLTGRTA